MPSDFAKTFRTLQAKAQQHPSPRRLSRNVKICIMLSLLSFFAVLSIMIFNLYSISSSHNPNPNPNPSRTSHLLLHALRSNEGDSIVKEATNQHLAPLELHVVNNVCTQMRYTADKKTCAKCSLSASDRNGRACQDLQGRMMQMNIKRRRTQPIGQKYIKNTLTQPLCLTAPMWGDHANRIVAVANGLRYVRMEKYGESARLALSSQWSKWFMEWFDEAEVPSDFMFVKEWDAIQLDKTKSNIHGCREHLHAKELYSRFPLFHPNPILFDLKPKRIFWDAAKKLFNLDSVTVHRHWDNACVHQKKILTPSHCTFDIQPFFVHQACRWTEDKIRKQLVANFPKDHLAKIRPIISVQTTSAGSQSPWFYSSDDFSIEDKHELTLQMVLFSLSHVHFGHPMSTIDYVVSHWRSRKGQIVSVRPEACYVGYQKRLAVELI
jgi:hypothetical protein